MHGSWFFFGKVFTVTWGNPTESSRGGCDRGIVRGLFPLLGPVDRARRLVPPTPDDKTRSGRGMYCFQTEYVWPIVALLPSAPSTAKSVKYGIMSPDNTGGFLFKFFPVVPPPPFCQVQL